MSPGAATGLRVLVSGRLAGIPDQGGATWAALQYILGLRQLGHDVTFVEPVDEGFDLRYAEAVLDRFDLRESAAFVHGRSTLCGRPFRELAGRDYDVLVNLSGVLRDDELRQRPPVRLYVDLDPVFTQLWHLHDGVNVGLPGHTHYATLGLRVGEPDNPVPLCDVKWIRTLPPVVLGVFERSTVPARHGWTTVGNWRSYGPVHLDGVRLGQRAHSMRALFDLPARLSRPITVALAIDESERTDRTGLTAGGWLLVDPVAAAGSPDRYRAFIAASRGEVCVAKEGYVLTRSGWFSDRSACYLACGRPVVAQDTGFDAGLPVGSGLLAFATGADAADAVERVERDYPTHARAARALAVEHLAADRVLTRLLCEAGAA